MHLLNLSYSAAVSYYLKLQERVPYLSDFKRCLRYLLMELSIIMSDISYLIKLRANDSNFAPLC